MLLHFKQEDQVIIDGIIYEVNASFDVILRIIDLLEEDGYSPVAKVNTILKALIGNDLSDKPFSERQEYMERILDIYVQMKEQTVYDRAGNPMPVPPKEHESGAEYSYKEDADYIYAAFMQTYRIDLIEEQGKLHWSKFKALLSGLPKDTMFSQIMQIRGWDPSDEKVKHNTRMKKLQDQYKLKGKGE